MSSEKKVLIVLVLVLLAESVFYHTQNYYTEKNKKAAIADVEITTDEKEVNVEPEYDKVKLFIVDKDTKNLVNKKESVLKSSNEKKVRLVFNKLKNISGNSFNKNSEVLNVFIEGNDRVYINLNRDFIEESTPSDVKTLTLYSVVNSVCALGYSKVKFIVENEEINKIGGEIPVQDYFEKTTLLLKGE